MEAKGLERAWRAGFGRAWPGKAMGRDGRIGDREWRQGRATEETVQQDRDTTMARGQHCACDGSDFPSTQPPQRLKSSGGRIGMEGEAACPHFRFPRDAGSVHELGRASWRERVCPYV